MAVRDKKADYNATVKANHDNLLEAIGGTVLLERPVETEVKEDCGQDRVEKRTCHLNTDMSQLEDKGRWKDLKSFIKIEKQAYYKAIGKTEREIRYYTIYLEHRNRRRQGYQRELVRGGPALL